MLESKITSFTKLVAWQKNHEFVIAIIKACEMMPRYDFLRSQLERAALSVTSNIAGGFGRQTVNDKKHFYVIARGSIYEVQNQLLVARDAGKITPATFQKLSTLSVGSVRLLHGLIRSLERQRTTSS